MALLTLDSAQNVSIEAALRLWLKKVADVNLMDLDPKTRSVTSVPLSFHDGMVRTEIFQKGVGSPPHLDIFQLKKIVYNGLSRAWLNACMKFS